MRNALLLLGSLLGSVAFAQAPDPTQIDFSVFRLLHVEEYASRASVRSMGPNLVTQNKHLLNFVFKRTDNGNASPPADHSDYYTHSYYFSTGSPNEVGTTPTPSGSNGNLNINVQPQQEFEVHLVPIDDLSPLSAGTVSFQVTHVMYKNTWNTQTQSWSTVTFSTTTYDATYSVLKKLCDDASIDTRKAFGQPNTDGVLPGDPNSEERNVNFGSWKYKGGLFIGNAYWTSNDQSGLARLQLWSSWNPGEASFAKCILSMLDLGKTSKFSGDVSLGVYVPDPNDANIASTENNVVWSTRWSSIVPRTTPTSPAVFWNDPLSTIAFSDSYSGFAYSNWNLQALYPNTQPALDRLCVAMTNESALNKWRYFASKEYQGTFSTSVIPQGDSQPRIWVVRLTGLTTTTVP